jgi:hypothetical protein
MPGARRWPSTSTSTPISAGVPKHARLGCSSSTSSPGAGAVRQIFDDPEGHHDWGMSAEVDLAESDEAGLAAVRITDVGMR